MRSALLLFLLIFTQLSSAQTILPDSIFSSHSIPLTNRQDGKLYDILIGETYRTTAVAEGWHEDTISSDNNIVYHNPYDTYSCVQKNKSIAGKFVYYFYKNGKRFTGKLEERQDKKGPIIFEALCKNGLVEGKGIFHIAMSYIAPPGSDSIILAEGNFEKGEMSGEWIYYKEGKIKSKRIYARGKEFPVKIWEYFPNGEIKFESVFKADWLHEIQKQYYENGQLKSEEILISYEQNPKSLSSVIEINEYKEYSSEGKLIISGRKKISPPHSSKTGTWKYFDADGKIIKEENY